MSGTISFLFPQFTHLHIPGEIVMDDEDAKQLDHEIKVGQAGDAGVVFLSLWDLRAGVIISQTRKAWEPARS